MGSLTIPKTNSEATYWDLIKIIKRHSDGNDMFTVSTLVGGQDSKFWTTISGSCVPSKQEDL